MSLRDQRSADWQPFGFEGGTSFLIKRSYGKFAQILSEPKVHSSAL